MFEFDDLARIEQPTLLLYGTADPTGSVEIWQRVTGALPHGELQLLKGAGYHPWFEDVQRVEPGERIPCLINGPSRCPHEAIERIGDDCLSYSAEGRSTTSVPRGRREADLVRRAQKGDEEAFAALVPAAVDHLFTVAYRICATPNSLRTPPNRPPDRLAQSPTLREPDRSDAWTYRLVVNACYAEAGRRRGNVTPLRLLADDAAVVDSAAQTHDRDQLERGFTTLSIAHRTVVVLHLHVGLPFEEIASMLDIPVGTARSLLHYALRALRSAIESDDVATGTGGTV